MATTGRVFNPARADHLYNAGLYKIEGQTLRSGDAYRARVLLFTSASIFPIRDQWSEADGAFSFTGLALGEYLLIAIDKSAERNAVTYSYVTSVAM